jgi:hypothetical protein
MELKARLALAQAFDQAEGDFADFWALLQVINHGYGRVDEGGMASGELSPGAMGWHWCYRQPEVSVGSGQSSMIEFMPSRYAHFSPASWAIRQPPKR